MSSGMFLFMSHLAPEAQTGSLYSRLFIVLEWPSRSSSIFVVYSILAGIPDNYYYGLLNVTHPNLYSLLFVSPLDINGLVLFMFFVAPFILIFSPR